MKKKKEFIIKGKVKTNDVYFVGFENQFIWGSEWKVRKYSETIVGATIYSSYESAEQDLSELPKEFHILPICPICNNEYDKPPAISRKDNVTEICPNCGITEALQAFNSQKK